MSETVTQTFSDPVTVLLLRWPRAGCREAVQPDIQGH